MASGHISRLGHLFYRICCSRHVRHFRAGAVLTSDNKSDGPVFDNNSNLEFGVTSDGKTIVCFHPSADVPYELTQPIPRHQALNETETHDQVLKARLSKEVLHDKQAPTIEELSKMFYTTKHCWYPVDNITPDAETETHPKTDSSGLFFLL